MFERFTKEARAAVIGAQTVARDVGSRSIDTRHVLVALAQATSPASAALGAVGVDTVGLGGRVRDELSSGGLDGEALASLGIDLEAVRQQADATFGEGALARGTRRAAKGHIPFTPDAKKALELALREAIRLGSPGIDAGHLLLGILRDTGSPAELALRRELTAAASDAAALRAAIEERQATAS